MKKVYSLLLGIIAFSMIQAQNHQSDSISAIKNHSLDEIVVTGSRLAISRDVTPVPVTVVGRQLLENSGETNLLPVLSQQVPSLFVTSRGMTGYGVSTGSAGGINLRGFSGGSGRVLMLIDGHPQYATIYGHPVADAYMASDAERVEISRGAASVLYGSNAMGGTINIITRKAIEDGNRLHISTMGGSYGTQRYSMTDSYKKGRFSGVVSGNYERTDGHRTNSEFDSWSGYAKLGYQMTNQWKLTGNINIAKSNSENPGTIERPMLDGSANVLRGMAGLSLENDYGNTSGAMNFYYNWGNHKINDGYFAGGSPREYLFRSTDYMGGVNMYQSVKLGKGPTITGGFDVKLYGGNAYRNPTTEIYADHIKLHEIAGYVLAQQELGKAMFEIGMRVEDNKLYGTEFIPQGGVSYQLAKYTRAKFSISKGFRSPNMRELYMYASANEDLLPEKSMSYDFTLSQRLFDNRLTLEASLYYTKGDNIVEVVQVEGRPQNQNVGKFINKGIEFSLNYQVINNLSINSNYSYLYMDNPIVGAPRNKLYAGVSYAPGKFILSAGVQTIDRLYLATGKNEQTTNFTLVDARIDYRALKWMNIFAKGDNLLAQKYETMLGFPMPRATFMGGISLNF